MTNATTAKRDLDAIKRKVGRKPFDERVKFVDGYTACPFHNGDSPKSMHLTEKSGVWLATCFSSCQKTWDAIDFVKQFEKIEFAAALKCLQGETVTAPPEAPKPKAKPMTEADWEKFGRALTPADIERLASSRKDKTASFETFKALGCRVKGDQIAFPYRHTVDGKTVFSAVRLRHMDAKDFCILNGVTLHGLFNLDTVNPLEDVYVVEGEPDVAVMEEAGYRAVSVTTGAQKKFERFAIEQLCMAPRIFLIGDQDASGEDPGQKCMDALQKVLPPEKTFRIKFNDAKDASELASKLGDSFTERIDELRDDSLTPWVRKYLPTISQLSQKPVEWVIDRLFPYGCLTMIAGSQGSMKSMFCVYAAQAIARCGPLSSDFLGRKVMAGIPVLYIDRENPEGEVSNRARSMGILANRNFIYWGDFNQEQTPELDDPRLLEFAHREKGFIVIDSLQDWYPAGFNENDNAKIVELMGKLRRLARAGAGVLVLHHNAKYGQVARGGTAFVALTDMAIKAGKSEASPDIVQLREERFRMCGAWELDVKAHWHAGELHNYAKHYQLELVRDEEVSEALRIAKLKEAAEEKELAVKIDGVLTANRELSQRKLAEKLGTTAPTAKKWAAKAGWIQEGEIWSRQGGGSDELLI